MNREKLREFHSGLIKILCEVFGPTLAAIFRIATEESKFSKPKTRAILEGTFGDLVCFDTRVIADKTEPYTRDEAIFIFKKIIETTERLSGKEGVNALANITAEYIPQFGLNLRDALKLMGIEFEVSEDKLEFRISKEAYEKLPLVDSIPFPVLVAIKTHFNHYEVEIEKGEEIRITAKPK